MKPDETAEVIWTPDMEISLLYAMIDHKPVGENKHFHMIFILEKYNKLNEKKMTVSQIWNHLNTLYDLNSLNENDIQPFPNEKVDFILPTSDFEAFIKEKSNCSSPDAEYQNKETKINSRKKSSRPSISNDSLYKKDKYEFTEDLNEDNSSNMSSSSISDQKKSSIDTGTNENSINSEDLELNLVSKPAKATKVEPRKRTSLARNEERKTPVARKRKN